MDEEPTPRAPPPQPDSKLTCPGCDGDAVIRIGKRKLKSRTGRVQRYKCKPCGTKFSEDNGFSRLRHSVQAVVTTLDLRAKGLSHRKIAHHLREVRQIPATKSTIERWEKRYYARLVKYVDQLGPNLGGVWHADETTLNVDGKLVLVWNMLDYKTRLWISSEITRGRTPEDARRPLKKAKRMTATRPKAIVTDSLASYNEAIKREFPSNSDPTVHLKIPPMRKAPTEKGHGTHPGNNVIERLQSTQRERTKVARGFDSIPTAQEGIDALRGYYNAIRPHMALGGLTPLEAAGVTLPSRPGQSRWLSLLLEAYKLERQQAPTNE